MNSKLRPDRASLKLAWIQQPVCNAGAAVCGSPLSRRRLWWQCGDAAGRRPHKQALHPAFDLLADTGARWENGAFIALWVAGLIGVGLALPL